MHLTPKEGSTGVHEVRQVVLDSGQKATITFKPEQSDSTFYVPTVAVEKLANSSYEIKADGSTQFGPSPVPPTDIDDLAQPFVVPIQFNRNLKIVIKNLSTADGRKYTVQLIGWEGD